MPLASAIGPMRASAVARTQCPKIENARSLRSWRFPDAFVAHRNVHQPFSLFAVAGSPRLLLLPSWLPSASSGLPRSRRIGPRRRRSFGLPRPFSPLAVPATMLQVSPLHPSFHAPGLESSGFPKSSRVQLSLSRCADDVSRATPFRVFWLYRRSSCEFPRLCDPSALPASPCRVSPALLGLSR